MLVQHRALLFLLQSCLDLKLSAFTDALVQTLSLLPDPSMRQLRWLEKLQALPDDCAVEVINRLAVRAQADRGRARDILTVVMDTSLLRSQLPPERLERWLSLAQSMRLPNAVILLKPEPAKLTYYRAGHVDVNEAMERPLGWRKTLARSTQRATIDRMVFDKHPAVVAALLENPRVLERDVVKLAALQPTTPEALQQVFAHARWIRRYTVKKALVCNPYAPTSMAESLLPFMQAPDLVLISRMKRLSPEVRDRASRLLAERPPHRPRAVPTLHAAGPLKPATAARAVAVDDTVEQFLSELPDVELLLEELSAVEALWASGHATETQPMRQLREEEEEDELSDFVEGLPMELTLVPLSEVEPDDEDQTGE